MNRSAEFHECVNTHLQPLMAYYKQKFTDIDFDISTYVNNKPNPIPQEKIEDMSANFETLKGDMTQTVDNLHEIIAECKSSIKIINKLKGRIPVLFRTINNHNLGLGLQSLAKMHVRREISSQPSLMRTMDDGILKYVVKKPYAYTVMPMTRKTTSPTRKQKTRKQKL